MLEAAAHQRFPVTVGGHTAAVGIRLEAAPHAPLGTVVVHLKGLPNGLCVVGLTETLVGVSGCRDFEVVHEAQAQVAAPACCPGAAPGYRAGEVVTYVKVRDGGASLCHLPPRFTVGTARAQADVRGALADAWRHTHLSGACGSAAPQAWGRQQWHGRHNQQDTPANPQQAATPPPPSPPPPAAPERPPNSVLPGFTAGREQREAQPGVTVHPPRRMPARPPAVPEADVDGDVDMVPDPNAPPGFFPKPIPRSRARKAADDARMGGDSESDAESEHQAMSASEPQSPRGPSSVDMEGPTERNELLTKIARGEPLRPGGLADPLTAADTSARASGDRRGLGADSRQEAPPECADREMQNLLAWAHKPLARMQQLVAAGSGPHMDATFYKEVDTAVSGAGDRSSLLRAANSLTLETQSAGTASGWRARSSAPSTLKRGGRLVAHLL